MRLPACLVLLIVFASPLVADPPPAGARLEPAHEAVDVDAKKVTRLTVEFDRPMSTTGWSFCGGGPTFPKFAGQPRWTNRTTCVVDVVLEPDRDYSILLNCPAGGNFRSAKGVKAPPTPWKFSTLPAKLPNPRRQRALNRQALSALQDVLESKYSYYDLRDVDWRSLFRKNGKRVLASQTTRVWAANVGKMLAPAGDVHLYLRLDDRVIATGRRAVDPAFRIRVVANELAKKRQIGKQALAGKTADGIGYLLIASWSGALDIDGVEKALATLRGSKALIVDVRPNSGGDELLARRVAAWFVDGTRVYSKNRYRTGKGKKGFGPVLERKITGNTDDDKRYRGRVVVLTSRHVMSSCEAFVLMMQQADDCTVIGQRTYGSSANPKPHELPNGVTIVAPSWQAMLPNGTCFEGKGIEPDVEVKVDFAGLDARDPILERALEILREQ